MKFIVKYSKERDVWNHLNTIWKFSFHKHGRKKIKNIIRKNYPANYLNDLWKAETEKGAKKIIDKYLNYLHEHVQNPTSLIVKETEKLLNENKGKIISRLETVYEEKFPFKIITVYIHTGLFSPYNYKERWFMTRRSGNEDKHVKIALHELNHFMFYYYYPQLKEKLGDEKYETLKEALAIYTNPEGNDKPNVQKLEDYFKKNLNKSIKVILQEKDWEKYL
jgi:hypothetical protein